MLDKDTFRGQMERLNVLFDKWRVDITDPETMKIWYSEFKGLSDEEFVRKVDKFVADSPYPPTVAGIMNENLKEKSKYQRASDRKVSNYDYSEVSDLWKQDRCQVTQN